MLESHDDRQLNELLVDVPCDVVLPDSWCATDRPERGMWSFTEDRRRYCRASLLARAIIEVVPTIPAIPRWREYIKVELRDISRCGIGFFAGRQLYPFEEIHLLSDVGKFRYAVTRCRWLGDRCYEVGAEIL